MATIKYEELVEEDLNVGTDVVWIHAPGGGELLSTQIGIHTVARGQKQYTATWSPGAIAVDSNASTTVTVPDATPGDFVMASHDKILKTDLRIMGHVSAADTVKVVIHNPTTASVTPASGTVAVVVFPSITAAATLPTIVQGTVTFNGNYAGELCVGHTVDLTDGLDVVQATTTTDAAGEYIFTNPTVTMISGAEFKIVAHAPPPGSVSGTIDTAVGSNLWTPETTMVVDVVMDGS